MGHAIEGAKYCSGKNVSFKEHGDGCNRVWYGLRIEFGLKSKTFGLDF